MKTAKVSPGLAKKLRIIKFLLASFFFFLALIFYVWSRTHAVQMGYELNEVIHQEQKLLERQRSLTLELQSLSNLERVERIARGKFGLVEPQPSQVIVLSKGTYKNSK